MTCRTVLQPYTLQCNMSNCVATRQTARQHGVGPGTHVGVEEFGNGLAENLFDRVGNVAAQFGVHPAGVDGVDEDVLRRRARCKLLVSTLVRSCHKKKRAPSEHIGAVMSR